ncbi:hypothetical protein [Bacillus mycoides]|uniref:hypothetical protein n=1 Tax=Bacillus mycoides TaxID=1405 RepID=UPI0014955270|nr:hypothetical protein [Bacillus mycoides]
MINQEALNTLRENLRGFVTALSQKQPDAHTEKEIAEMLEKYKLTSSLFRSVYLKKIR